MGILKALAIGTAVYLGGVLGVLLIPIVGILGLWTGLCILASIFLFFFWLFVTHSPHTLTMALYMLVWGAPPCLGAALLGHFGGRLRARRKAPTMTLRQDAPFR
jgi:hypothetical protein